MDEDSQAPIEMRTLGELRDAVAGLIEDHGEAFPLYSANGGMGVPCVTLEVIEHWKAGPMVMVS